MFGTLGINFRARKAKTEEEWIAAMASPSCEVPAKPTQLATQERREGGDNHGVAG
jgi:hypothetical protein